MRIRWRKPKLSGDDAVLLVCLVLAIGLVAWVFLEAYLLTLRDAIEVGR